MPSRRAADDDPPPAASGADLSVALSLVPGEEGPLRGSLRLRDEPHPLEFVGWMELMVVLERLRRERPGRGGG